jgi:tetratricopeptide (TPR) repeat protein
MKKSFVLLLALTSVVSLSSCSSLVESTRKMVDGDTPRKSNKKPNWVSKSEYDDLMLKYKDLNDRYNQLREEKSVAENKYDQAAELSQKSGTKKSSDVETVDVFGQGGLASEVTAQIDEVSASVSDAPIAVKRDLESELSHYKKAMVLLSNGNADDALKIFQYLEKSSSKQMRVRARVQIGKIYLEKKQFDLALQVYETVISQDAFSGHVLDALAGAVLASGQLGLADKKLRYQSMLQDVFGIKG